MCRAAVARSLFLTGKGRRDAYYVTQKLDGVRRGHSTQSQDVGPANDSRTHLTSRSAAPNAAPFCEMGSHGGDAMKEFM